ncbi:hypothetical protein KP615_09390 [Treponema denticola]|uniref:hypothetical protein n=1 Tax=Treponema denticola TaxID=158 RepID=UPI003CFD9C8E
MTKIQKTKCNEIIEKYKSMVHTYNSFSGFAVKSLLGVSVDISTVSAMIIELANVCGLFISENEADGFSIAALKRTVMEKPIQIFIMEKVKNLPVLKRIFSPMINAVMLKNIAWKAVDYLDKKVLFDIGLEK